MMALLMFWVPKVLFFVGTLLLFMAGGCAAIATALQGGTAGKAWAECRLLAFFAAALFFLAHGAGRVM